MTISSGTLTYKRKHGHEVYWEAVSLHENSKSVIGLEIPALCTVFFFIFEDGLTPPITVEHI